MELTASVLREYITRVLLNSEASAYLSGYIIRLTTNIAVEIATDMGIIEGEIVEDTSEIVDCG